MAAEDNNQQENALDPEATVLASAADPEATVLAAANDPEATVLADSTATTVVPRSAPRVPNLDELPELDDPTDLNAPATVVAAAPRPAPASDLTAVDGIDALDDPYYSPATLDNLTTAYAPVSIDSPVSKPSRGRRIAKVVITVLLVIFFAGLAVGAGWYTYQQELWGGKTVPDVIGKTEVEARHLLEAKGYKVTTTTEASDEAVGTVISCDPQPGVRANPSDGATITLAASRTIPQVVGMTQEEAQKALSEAGATNVVLSYVASTAEDGTVVEVSPSEGSAFVSADTVTISIAQPYTVPTVVGLTLTDAQAALEKAGLTSTVKYVESGEASNTVVASSPEQGTKIDAGAAVVLEVSSPYPSSTTKLLEFFDCSSTDAAAYLAEQKATLKYGAKLSNGDAHAIYQDAAGNLLTFSDTPESGSYRGNSTDDVLAGGASIGGVRIDFANAPSTDETEAGLQAVMTECGFTSLSKTATQADLAAAGIQVADGTHFICGYGETGNYSWAVMIGGTSQGNSAVTALVAPKNHFNGGIDLSKYGNNVCLYIAMNNL